MSLLALFLFSGVITQEFLVGPDSAKGFQARPVVAVCESGYFAVAWEDSTHADLPELRGNVYIRFFDKEGSPLTPSIKLDRDTIGLHPRLAEDDGRFICLWNEAPKFMDEYTRYAQIFDSLGGTVTERFEIGLKYQMSLAADPSNGFMTTYTSWDTICAQRYTPEGDEAGERIKVYSPEDAAHSSLRLDVNDEGQTVIAWHYNRDLLSRYLCFQVLDSTDQLMVPDSFRRVTEGQLRLFHKHPRVRWFDNDRFAVFWLKVPNRDYCMINGVQAKIFNPQGDSLTSIATLLDDYHASTTFGLSPLCVSTIHDGAYAVAYERRFDGPGFAYHRAAGFLADTSLERTSGIFRLSSAEPHYYQQETQPSVDACSDRIVWVWMDNTQQREHGDTVRIIPYYTDIRCKITDWDIEGVAEQPIIRESPIRLEATINRLSYDLSGEAELTIYSADGRKVLAQPVKGRGVWTPSPSSQPSSQPSSHLPSGVYFAKITSPEYSARAKVVIIH